MKLHILMFFLFSVLPVLFAAGSDATESGNITTVNTSIIQNSSWHGVCGQSNALPPLAVTINATAGNISYHEINVGSSTCQYGVAKLYLLFSNSSSPITSLYRGNLSILHSFVSRVAESPHNTFVSSKTFITGNYGTIKEVPTAYTESPVPWWSFKMGYLQDQGGNLVFITPVVDNMQGFNGSEFDFQLMLPTRNGSTTEYYVTVDLECLTGPPEGGGTHTPYYNETVPVEPPVIPGENITRCDIVLHCMEWGPCINGYRSQRCRDLANCSDVEVFRVERCPEPELNITEISFIIQQRAVYVIEKEYIFLPLLVLIMLSIMVWLLYRGEWKRRRKK